MLERESQRTIFKFRRRRHHVEILQILKSPVLLIEYNLDFSVRSQGSLGAI